MTIGCFRTLTLTRIYTKYKVQMDGADGNAISLAGIWSQTVRQILIS